MEDKDLQTITLAGLLHDIGKFYARSHRVQNARRDAAISGRHPVISTLIVEGNFAKLLEKIELDIDLLKTLIQHHHEDPRFPQECLVQSLTGKEKNLALIVSRADNYSSSERFEDAREEKGTYETVLLDSIFSRVDIGQGQPQQGWRIKPQPLDSTNIFPERIDKASWENLVEEFGKELNALRANDFDSLYICLISLIQKYCWSTPSDITREIVDVSLFDHLKTTSAIASCLYQYHNLTNTLYEAAIKDEKPNKFMLIGGDISGIQRYIYDIAEVGVGGVAKRLRARSFMLSLLLEVTAHHILHKLELPFSCLLFSSGGRFYILAPGNSATLGKLSAAITECQEWLLKEYLGEIAINFAAVRFAPKRFSADNSYYPENFRGLWEEFQQEMEKEKLAKFSSVLKENKQWSNKFLSEVKYENDLEGVCRSCRKFPAQYFLDETNQIKVCEHCANDQKIGSKLLNAKYLIFYSDGVERDLNFYGQYNVEVTSSSKPIGTPYLVVSLNQPEHVVGYPGSFKYLANHVPIFHNKDELDKQCEACLGKSCELREEFRDFPHIYNFQCLSGSAEGADCLSAIKADVDFLGLAFNQIESLSISRMTEFSNFLDIFFSGYLPTFFEENFFRTYVVYSGGDDLLVIGPWDEMISLSKNIRDEFQRFCAHNPNLHLSAGIALSKPKFPVANTVEATNDILDKAKGKEERNQLSILSATFDWSDFEKLINFGNLLVDALNNKRISSAFVYRLLTYQSMFERSERGDTSGLLYLSRLAYDIKRNLFGTDGEAKDEALIAELNKLFDYKEEGKLLMKNLKFPVSYALLKQRG